MALNIGTLSSTLTATIKANIISAFNLLPGGYDDVALTNFASAMGSGIATDVINHFVANAEILPNTFQANADAVASTLKVGLTPVEGKAPIIGKGTIT